MVEGNTTYLPLLVVHAVSLRLRQAQIRAVHLLTFACLLFFSRHSVLGKPKYNKAPTGSQRCGARTKSKESQAEPFQAYVSSGVPSSLGKPGKVHCIMHCIHSTTYPARLAGSYVRFTRLPPY